MICDSLTIICVPGLALPHLLKPLRRIKFFSTTSCVQSKEFFPVETFFILNLHFLVNAVLGSFQLLVHDSVLQIVVYEYIVFTTADL